ncbi:MAG: hypothetical protein WBP79_10990 [Candidatus Acidiferrales bacterium]
MRGAKLNWTASEFAVICPQLLRRFGEAHFPVEKRYVDRLSNRPLTDTASIPNDSIDALFQFGGQGRKDLKKFVEMFPAQEDCCSHPQDQFQEVTSE